MDHSNAVRSPNMLLNALAADDFELLAPQLELVHLAKHFVMERPGERIRRAYFPIGGLGSVIAVGERQRARRIESGIFGRDGMSGTAVVMGYDRSPNETFSQIEGAALRIEVDALRAVMAERPAIREVFLGFVHVMLTQVAQTVLANAHGRIEERLARWLLMSHDRLEGDEVPLTHEFLSLMLGVRRAGVTVATHMLEGQGLIRATRGLIVVIDREGLEEASDGSYGVAEAEYRRVIGGLGRGAQARAAP